MRYIIPAYTLLLFLFTFCNHTIESDENDFELYDTVSIKFGETLINNNENISIKFDSLLSDSRCPIDVICIWEGDAEVKFKFAKTKYFEFLFLHTFQDFVNIDTVHDEYEVKLIDLFPYPNTTIEIDSSNYIAEIVISRI